MIYDNYNAVAAGWAPTLTLFDTLCPIAVNNNNNVHFGFYWGSKLADPEKMLIGNGKQYRYVRVETKINFPQHM